MNDTPEVRNLKHQLRVATADAEECRKRLAKIELSHRQYDRSVHQIHALCTDAGIAHGNVVTRVKALYEMAETSDRMLAAG